MMSFLKKDLRSSISLGLIALLLFAVGAVFYSCYPGDPISVAEADVVTTFYDPNANFASQQTYAMPDSVIHVGDDEISRIFDDQILDRIRQNMQQLNYTEVADPAQADVLVLPAGLTTEWIAGGCYWYWGYWYPYPGWCYPVAYSYTTGTVLIAMADADNTSQANALWVAGINGLVSESTVGDISNRINKNIDQAFDQSPYLGEGK
jgi:hypothetical protein